MPEHRLKSREFPYVVQTKKKFDKYALGLYIIMIMDNFIRCFRHILEVSTWENDLLFIKLIAMYNWK